MNTTAKRALVTGGSGGLGAAICRRLGGAGHFVYVHAHRSEAAAEATAGAIIAAGGAAAVVCFDLPDAAASRVALEKIL
jgi:3-oxoacyl-[acyl-carrier protein] reductase